MGWGKGGIASGQFLEIMQTTDYFLLADGRLRAGWRMALFLAFFAIFSMAIDMGISITSAEISFTTQIISFATATAATTWFVMRFFEQQPVWAVGIALQGSWRRHALTGMIGGVCGVAFITLIAWATGTVEFQSAES